MPVLVEDAAKVVVSVDVKPVGCQKSEYPVTCGDGQVSHTVPGPGDGWARMRRISTSRQHGIASFAARRDPGRPASASATSASALFSGGVRRPDGVVRPGICSENVACAQRGLAHLSLVRTDI